jgi:hypothetical protein
VERGDFEEDRECEAVPEKRPDCDRIALPFHIVSACVKSDIHVSTRETARDSEAVAQKK